MNLNPCFQGRPNRLLIPSGKSLMSRQPQSSCCILVSVTFLVMTEWRMGFGVEDGNYCLGKALCVVGYIKIMLPTTGKLVRSHSPLHWYSIFSWGVWDIPPTSKHVLVSGMITAAREELPADYMEPVKELRGRFILTVWPSSIHLQIAAQSSCGNHNGHQSTLNSML